MVIRKGDHDTVQGWTKHKKQKQHQKKSSKEQIKSNDEKAIIVGGEAGL